MLVLLTFTINAGFNFALGLLVAHFLGPADFGRYAFAQALGVLINVTFIDWVRLSATRFYSQKSREVDRSVRRTLDTAFISSSILIAVVCGFCLIAGVNFGLSTALAASIPVVAVAYSLFDYHAAMTRALFREKLYALIVISKNGLSLALMVGGAWYFKDPVIVMAGLCLSLVAAWLTVRRPLAEPKTDAAPTLPLARTFFLYAMPIVLANTFYQMIPLYNRSAISGALGFAEMGQYSLAFDLSTKLFSAVGSAFDILLFQLAVRSHNEDGLDAARVRLSSNLGIVLGAIAPLAVGLWFVLPSLEAAFVPEQFKGAFSDYVSALIPGLSALSMILYGLNPIFQIRNRTYPIILACLVAVLVNVVLIARLPADAAGPDYARMQTYALYSAIVVTLAFAAAIMPTWPSPRSLMGCAAGLVAMSAVLCLMRLLPPGLPALLVSALAGAEAYLVAQLLVNSADVRAVLLSRRQQKSPAQPG